MGIESRRRKSRTNWVPIAAEGGKPKQEVCSADELKQIAIQTAKDMVVAARATQLGIITPTIKQIIQTELDKSKS